MADGDKDKQVVPADAAQQTATEEELVREQMRRAILGPAARRMQAGADGKPTHRFWGSQPVPQEGDDADGNEPLEVKTVDQIRAEPLALPRGFEWSVVDVSDEAQLQELYELLTNNYVEDDEGSFRFDYRPAFLRWALNPPGFIPDWLVGVRRRGQLVGFISGIPVTSHVYDKTVRMCEINFLCVHKTLRSKRLAPVLIKEVTRRVNLTDVWQAVYTAGVELPRPVSACLYWHRLLQPKKLVDIGFTRRRRRITMAAMMRLYRVNQTPTLAGLRPMTAADVPSVGRLLRNHLASKFDLWVEWDDEEIAHWLLPREGVVSSFVRVAPAEGGEAAAPAEGGEAAAAGGAGGYQPGPGDATDLISFYHLPSSVLGNPRHDRMLAGYSFYNVAGTVSLKELMQDALHFAHRDGCDVFNALELMEQTEEFLTDLKFGRGDGRLHYYLYNWGCKPVSGGKLGLVLL